MQNNRKPSTNSLLIQPKRSLFHLKASYALHVTIKYPFQTQLRIELFPAFNYAHIDHEFFSLLLLEKLVLNNDAHVIVFNSSHSYFSYALL